MNILVTGGAGYIGSHTCKALKLAGHYPIVLDNLSYGHESACLWGPFEKGDLADIDFIRTVLQKYSVEAVVHFAGSTYVGESMKAPLKYFRNNVVNTINLLEAMQERGVAKIVFSSTCATYGTPQSDTLDESHAQKPINAYGESKLFVERILNWCEFAYAIRSICLRYFNAAGASSSGEIGEDHDPETHLIPLVIHAALGGPSIKIFGTDYPTSDGTAVRDYIHVEDLASAHVAALDHLNRGGDSLRMNVGTGRGRSVYDIINAVERVSKLKVPIELSSRREGDPAYLVADASKIQKLLGWIPRHVDIDTVVLHAWNWHRNRLNI